jgi:hypothetical protein
VEVAVSEAIKDQLQAAFEARAPQTIHDLAMSLASYIAAIDSRSVDVAAYLEQRLQPLIPLMRTDCRVEHAVERMRDDGRQLTSREGLKVSP